MPKSWWFSALATGVLFLPLTLWAQAPEEAPQPQPAPAVGTVGDKVTLDFREIELQDFIQTISELTGRNFIYDETVKGKVTITSPEPMTLDQAYRLFLTVLNIKGYTVVPTGKANKIVPVRDAKESALPLVTQPRPGVASEQYVTRIVPLNNLDASTLANTVLAPLVPKTSSIIAYEPANAIVITDSATNIERLVEIIRELDIPSTADLLEVIPLQYADAQEVSQIAGQIITQSAAAAPARRRRTAANVQAAQGAQDAARIIPYTRTNSLVVMANPDDLLTIRRLVSKLDQEPAQARAGINVYYLENADAETLAKTLNEIVTGLKAQQPRPGTQRQAQAAPGQQAPALEAVAITADKPTNALIINSTASDYELLRDIIRQLDVRRKQVFVEALILELSMDATKNLGASLQGAIKVGDESVVLGSSNLNTGPAGLTSLTPVTEGGAPGLLTQTINGILLGGLFNLITVEGPNGEQITIPAISALIDLSKTTSDVNILSAPRLLTSDNEEAEIIVGQNVPIITQRLTDTGASAGLAQSVVVERRDVALTLRFTPQITEGDLVRLNVYQEITDIAATSVGDVNQVGPTLTKRLIRNTVLAQDSRTVVLGGLIQNNAQETVFKVPVLGDIPGLGWLFKRKSTTNRKTNLLVFITPKIIRSAEELALVTRRSKAAMDEFQAGLLPQPGITPPEAELTDPERPGFPVVPAPIEIPQLPPVTEPSTAPEAPPSIEGPVLLEPLPPQTDSVPGIPEFER